MNKTTPNRHLATLERRADHLAKRIATSDIDLTYDKSELAALRWAVKMLSERSKKKCTK